MTEDKQGRQRTHKRLWLLGAVLVAILAVAIVPPLVSVSRYKNQITHLMAVSLGRPVRLSSVELRLLPRPGFVLTDLTVEEDPAYGTEPVLHANTVTASFRLLSLWRGRLEISQISVDEASLNLVRTTEGRWNLESLFRTAAAHAANAAGPRKTVKLPYLEATNSRINFKSGAEKLPFSVVESDLSFWQENPGEWRLRLRGQPARTDVSLDLADTGMLRMEATVRQAAELRQAPVHLDVDWRDAQLGQLTRLMIGSDPGWRGDLTGELHLDGTAESAQIQSRLRATGVHRVEFAPAAPMDFDARCNLNYHFLTRSMENLACDSPLGDGHIRVAGSLPGESGLPHLAVELDRVPVAAGLDALRTVRSGFGPGLEAKGTVSGKMVYAELPPQPEEKPAAKTRASAKDRQAKAHTAPVGPLTGSLIVEGLQLSGDGLSIPIEQSRLELDPLSMGEGQQPAMVTTLSIPAGGVGALAVHGQLSLSGYRLTVQGQASMPRARELAKLAGVKEAEALDEVAGEPLAVDLVAEGPWMPVEMVPASSPAAGALAASVAQANALPTTDRLSGTVTLHNANWKAGYLANAVEIAQATLHIGEGQLRWDPVAFSYGPVKGTATLDLPQNCAAGDACLPRFQVQFGALDAGALQAAILGAREPHTLLSTLIARLRPSASVPAWPQLDGTVKADSLILGPVTLRDATATVRVLENGAHVTALDASVLGGHLHAAGSLYTPADDANKQTKPAYMFEGKAEKLNPAGLGQLLGLRFAGGDMDAEGKIELSGFTGPDLATSAKGLLHLDWRHGTVAAQGDLHKGPLTVAAAAKGAAPAAPIRFDHWTSDVEFANGIVTLKQNEMLQGTGKREVEGAVSFTDAAKVPVAPKAAQARR